VISWRDLRSISRSTGPGASCGIGTALLLALAFTTCAARSDSPQDPWFAEHAYIAMDQCVAIPKGRSLSAGDTITLFEAGQPIIHARIAGITDADSAASVFNTLGFEGVYSNKSLWARIGCWWGCRAFHDLSLLAHYEGGLPDPEVDVGYPLVLQGLPRETIVVGGDRSPLTAAELSRLPIGLDAPDRAEFRSASTLRAGFRYGWMKGQELIEVHVGRSFDARPGAAAPIDSVHILSLTLLDGREISSERYSRISGQEEHVDLEPPQLDKTNWFETTIETLGFLSLDRGASWIRLDRDTGFEGIDWMAWKLAPRPKLLWDYYLDTDH